MQRFVCLNPQTCTARFVGQLVTMSRSVSTLIGRQLHSATSTVSRGTLGRASFSTGVSKAARAPALADIHADGAAAFDAKQQQFRKGLAQAKDEADRKSVMSWTQSPRVAMILALMFQ